MITGLLVPLLVSVPGHTPFISVSLCPDQDPALRRCSRVRQKGRLDDSRLACKQVNTVSVLEESRGQ